MSVFASSTTRGSINMMMMNRLTAIKNSSAAVKSSGIRQSTTFASSASEATTASTANPFTRAFRWYNTKLETHPILTKSLTAGVIGCCGDVLCQYYIDKPEKELKKEVDTTQSLWWLDVPRAGRFFVLGTGLVGPWCHYWFGWLATTFPKLTFSSVATRVALDQLAFTPIILSTFISSLWTLEHVMDETPQKEELDIPKRLYETLPSLWMTNIAVWTPVQLFNFGFVKPSYQVLFANMISLVWNAYISFSTRGNTAKATVVDEDDEQTSTIENEITLVREETGLPPSVTAPVVLVQRITTKVVEVSS